MSEDKATKEDKKLQRTIDGFDNFISRIGLNNNNSLSGGMYTFNLVTRNRVQLEAAYRGSWIVGKVIDSIPEDMTREGIDINTNEGEEDIKDIQAEISKLQIWSSMCDGQKWGDLYGGALGVFQIEGQDMSTPLDVSTIAQGQFKGLAIYDRWQLNPDVVRVIKVGPEMGLPAMYQIVTNPVMDNLVQVDQNKIDSSGMINVHHSRVIRFTGIKLPFFQAITEMLWGESRLERLWDRLIAFDNATMSAASLIDRANLRTVGIEGLRQIIAAGGKAQQGLEAMFEMMRYMQTNEGLTLIDKNDTFQSTSYSFSGLAETLLQFGQQLAGAADTPMVRLFGQSPAGLNSTGESDIRTYYDYIKAKQESRFRPGVEKLLKIIWQSKYGKPPPQDIEFDFVPLWQMSSKDRADLAKTNTESIIAAKEAGLVSAPVAMKELRGMSGDTGLFSNISDEDVKEAELEPPPLAPEEGEEPKEQDVVKNLDSKSTLQRIKLWLTK